MRENERPTFDQLAFLADHFDTSLTATAIRWMNLASDYCALVVSKAGRIAWWCASDSFEDSLWINAGDVVSSFAAASAVSTTDILATKEVTIDTWAQSRNQLTTDRIIEEAKYLRGYDRVLSLLWLP